MFILGFAGCIGALRENSFLLKFVRGLIVWEFQTCLFWVALEFHTAVTVLTFQFSVFLGIIFFLELTAGVLAFVFKDWIKDQLNFFINNNIRAYRDDIDLQNLIDFTQEYVRKPFLRIPFWFTPALSLARVNRGGLFQRALVSSVCVFVFFLQWECCGAFGADDWNLNIYFNCTDSNPSREKCGVPFSCCTKDPGVCPHPAPPPTHSTLDASYSQWILISALAGCHS